VTVNSPVTGVTGVMSTLRDPRCCVNSAASPFTSTLPTGRSRSSDTVLHCASGSATADIVVVPLIVSAVGSKVTSMSYFVAL
jgi:hypothetical protein